MSMKCPSNYHDSESHQNCTVCRNGIIPSETIDFIKDFMTEQKDYFECQINQILIPPTGKNIINFKICKSTFNVFGLTHLMMYNTEIPANTVQLIDFLKKSFSKNDFVKN